MKTVAMDTSREFVALAFLVALPYALLYLRRPPAEAASCGTLSHPTAGKGGVLWRCGYFADGRLVVVSARDASGKESLWIRPLNSLDAHPLAGTELGSLAVLVARQSLDRLFLLEASSRRLMSQVVLRRRCATRDGDACGTWNRDGVIVFMRRSWRGFVSHSGHRRHTHSSDDSG